MLERYFPGIYGWLIWGGGLYQLRLAFRWLLILSFIVGIFYLGRWSV